MLHSCLKCIFFKYVFYSTLSLQVLIWTAEGHGKRRHAVFPTHPAYRVEKPFTHDTLPHDLFFIQGKAYRYHVNHWALCTEGK